MTSWGGARWGVPSPSLLKTTQRGPAEDFTKWLMEVAVVSGKVRGSLLTSSDDALGSHKGSGVSRSLSLLPRGHFGVVVFSTHRMGPLLVVTGQL